MTKGQKILKELFDFIEDEFHGCDVLEDLRPRKKIITKELKAFELLRELILYDEDTILYAKDDNYILYVGGISFYLSKEQYKLLNEVCKDD